MLPSNGRVIFVQGVLWWRLIRFMKDQQFKDITVTLPQQLLNEVDALLEQENLNRSEFISRATKTYIMEKQQSQIRESMQQGYMEMAKINLTIASEAFLAEEEADLPLVRLVSGV